MSLSAEHAVVTEATGAGGGADSPPNRNTSPVESRTLLCQSRSRPPGDSGLSKCVSRKSPSINRHARWRVTLMSKPTPNIAANVLSEPRGVQLLAQFLMVTALAWTPPASTSANGVNLSYRRYDKRGPTAYV